MPNTTTPITVRPALLTDAPAISAVGTDAFTASFGHTVKPEQLHDYLEENYSVRAIAADLTHEEKRFFVAVGSSSSGARLNGGSLGGEARFVRDGEVVPSNGADGQEIGGGEEVLGFIQLTLNTSEPCLAPYIPPPTINSTSSSPIASNTPSSTLIELQRLYISTPHQSLGLGHSLVSTATSWAIRQGFRAMWLGVWEFNPKARAFYEREGFKVVGEHGFVIGGRVDRDLVMVRVLVEDESRKAGSKGV